MSQSKKSFYAVLKQGLVSRGFRSRGKGIYTHATDGDSMDWVSVLGNSYFCTVNVGVAFPSVSTCLKRVAPVVRGVPILDNVNINLLPLIFAPLERYVPLPPFMTKATVDAPLNADDAEQLSTLASDRLLKVLSPFHSLKEAVPEARETMRYNGFGMYLIILAYLVEQKIDDASELSQEALEALPDGSLKDFYSLFIENVEREFNVHLTRRSHQK